MEERHGTFFSLGETKVVTPVTVDDQFEKALRSPKPTNGLRALALALAAEGLDQDALLDVFERRCRAQLRVEDRETDEDAVMDFLVGWCSPTARLPINSQAAPFDSIGPRKLPTDQSGRLLPSSP